MNSINNVGTNISINRNSIWKTHNPSFRYYPVTKKGKSPPGLPGQYRIKTSGDFIHEKNNLYSKMKSLLNNGKIKTADDYFEYIVEKRKVN
jgi:hypothetical protein